jgi:hypothetical protein
MFKTEAELKAQIDAPFKRAQQAEEAEKNEPELDIPVEIARRETRLAAIAQARQRLGQRQREADIERGCDPDDKPRDSGELPTMPRALQNKLGATSEPALTHTSCLSAN